MDIFAGKTAIVTGGASGIGRALGEELAQRGALVTLADINPSLVEEAAASLNGRGHEVKAAVLDVTDYEAVKKLVSDTVSERGRLDYMFNNAGIAILGEAVDMSMHDWRSIIDVNLYGVVHGAVAAYEVMVGQGYGHIVNTSSLAGIVPLPGTGPYTTSKYGVMGISEVLRMEGAKYGVKVSAVCPGVIKTPIYSNIRVAGLDRGEVEQLTPYGTSPERCARVILRGIERNRGMIRVSALTHVLYVLQRVMPGVLRVMGRGMLAFFRAGKRKLNG